MGLLNFIANSGSLALILGIMLRLNSSGFLREEHDQLARRLALLEDEQSRRGGRQL